MASVHIRDVPDDVLAKLRSRAAAQQQSLQAHLLGMLADAADSYTSREAADRAREIALRSSASADDIAEAAAP